MVVCVYVCLMKHKLKGFVSYISDNIYLGNIAAIISDNLLLNMSQQSKIKSCVRSELKF